ncbi:MAG: DUF4340 domain-containing protein, partial [Verrucomicrobiota bacterium]
MQRRTTLLLLGAVLLVGAYIGFIEPRNPTTDVQREYDRMAFPFQPEDVTFLRLEKVEQVLELEKEQSQWWLNLPSRSRADQGAVDRLIGRMHDFERRTFMTTEEMEKEDGYLHDYGLIRPQARLTIGSRRSRETFLIGKENATGTAVYVKRRDGDEIFRAPLGVMTLFEAKVAELLDRVLFFSDSDQLHRFDVRRTDGYFRFERDSGGIWTMNQPVVGRADQSVLGSLTDVLLNLRVEQFVLEQGGDPAAYGLKDPVMQIAIQNEDSEETQVLKVGKTLDDNPDRVYAMLEGDPKVMAVSMGLIKRFGFKVEDVRDRRVVPFAPAGLTGVRIQKQTEVLELGRSEEGLWDVVVPRQWKADQEQVQTFLTAWTGANIESFEDPAAETNRFAEPSCTLSFHKVDAAPSTQTVSVLILEPSGADGMVDIMVKPDRFVCRIPALLLDRLPLDPLRIKDREVLALSRDAIRKITLVRGAMTMAVEKNGAGSFQPAEDATAALHMKTVDELLVYLAGLR